MTISIICTNKDPKPWVEALEELDPTLDIQVWPSERNKADVEFVLCWNHPEGVLANYPNLRCICSMGAGIDHLLNDVYLPKDLPILRIVDPLLAQSMFEYICAAVMCHYRGFDLYNAQQGESNWFPQPPKSISQTTIGMMGLGHIGEYTANRFSEFGFNVIGWSRTQKNIKGVRSYTGEVQLDEFLSHANILICLLPLTNETRDILNLKNFNKLPTGAYLVNVARGEHLVEEDLITALNEGQLRGACLDVFREEPLIKNHLFWQHDKIFVTPHCASITDPISVAPQILNNYRLMQDGKPLLNQVNLMRGY
ncbi:2-hydroxyacid dehydrogenase [Alkalimarinus alittae]|uniref:Glyoxylate/hydroxypyruvate reductase A n=1 Tax=Alkalimarinus alittae TaxID=2961619 RepID=A0ABY6N447_9ALTE|nr:glyoxylate/hydroxypyruvate reductase A [Alkalimarinus alittae]UZE96893.1 glyoxylate/hydroxypyruvate reductase A [Alkalimarinus alittae]